MSWNIKTPGDYINGPLTVAGSATITGDLTVDTSTLKVDSTNNRVGIKTATPVSSLQVLDGDITVTTGNSFCGFNGTRQTIPGEAGVQLSRLHFSGYSTGTTYVQGASIEAFSNDIWSASSAPGYLSFQTTPSASVTLTERMRIEAAGDVTISTGNVVMATSGKGIDFSATAGTGTSELLNDYEEGAWTPTSTSGTNLTSIVHLLAKYTKVGRVVTLSGYFSATVTTGSTLTYATLAGLPFAVTLGQAGSAYEDVTLKVGFSQANTTDLNVFFAAGTALASGSKTFTYTITYQV